MYIILADKAREEELAAMSKEARNRYRKKQSPESGAIERMETVSNSDHEDSIYYELDENDQMVRAKPKESGNDSIYYELDDNGQMVRSKPSPAGMNEGVSYSKDSDNVLLNATQPSSMFQKK